VRDAREKNAIQATAVGNFHVKNKADRAKKKKSQPLVQEKKRTLLPSKEASSRIWVNRLVKRSSAARSGPIKGRKR